MGIRFRCPNGHKIHVKAFLAGKRGICPVCGLKVPIPQESDPEFADRPAKKRKTNPRTAAPPSSASRSAARPAASVTGAGPALPNLAEPPGKSHPSDNQTGLEPSGPILDRPEIQVPRPRDPTEPQSAAHPPPAAHPPLAATELPRIQTDLPRPESESQRPGGVADPIAAAPQARWFVRPPSGGQFGPAPGVVLRDWMAEGRVTPDTYVWREGWPEWRRAEAVFGDFLAMPSPSGATLPEVATSARPLTTSEMYRQRKSTKMTLLVVGLLALTCVLLFAALVYVVRFMG